MAQCDMEWTKACVKECDCSETGRPIQEFTSGLKAKDWKAPHWDLGQYSLEYWDYTVELEMLKNGEDLQLAAELGKTLLERNRELEFSLKDQQKMVDDQTQEIMFLSKQTVALREANESRLRIYEQLEISIQDLEKANQRLVAEGAADKRKITKLSGTVEQLESKCDDLQKALEEAKSMQPSHNSYFKNSPATPLREARSIANAQQQITDDLMAEVGEARARCQSLEGEIILLQDQTAEEARKKEDLEIELSCLSQENNVLREQLLVLKERANFRTLEDELSSVADTSATSSLFCKKCMGVMDETESNLTMQDLDDDLETSFDCMDGECALVKLNNGGYAYGSQESLVSMGKMIKSNASTSPTEASEAPHNSLLSELDTQYRILIEKYEALVDSRENYHQETKADCQQSVVDSGVDTESGALNLMLTETSANSRGALRCQRCTSCACASLKVMTPRPSSNADDFSEVETSSSGFSDSESRVSCKFTQTELSDPIYDDATPTTACITRCLDLTSPLDPFENRFHNMPIYKQLFQEIFKVLKKTVDENEAKLALTKSLIQSYPLSELLNVGEEVNPLKEEGPETQQNADKPEETHSRKCDDVREKITERTSGKLPRPDFLDLKDSSRSSSRHRRKRRSHRHRHCDEQSANNPTQSKENVIPSRQEKQASATDEVVESSLTAKLEAASTSQQPSGRCEHASRSRKHRKHRNTQLINKHLSNVTNQSPQRSSFSQQPILFPCAATKAALKLSHPSVEVAKLRQLEVSYAEVLKSSLDRNRKYTRRHRSIRS